MSEAVFLKIQGTQVGPVTKIELGQWVRQKKVTPNDFIWDDESEQWLPTLESDFMRDMFILPDAHDGIMMAFGGGKGGVGKTALTMSVGIFLASLGHKVVIVDADLGGANLHTFMGIDKPELTFYDFYTMKKSSLSEIMLPTQIENLYIISGACGTLGLANPKYSQKLRFIRELKKIDADYILLDLGAGSSYNEIDFFLAAGQGIVITTPEPASIEEAYYFLKKALMRKLYHTFRKNEQVVELFDMEDGTWNKPTANSIKELYKEVEKVDTEAASIFRGILQKFQPWLILNMVMTSDESKEAFSLKAAINDLLCVDIDLLGSVRYDSRARDASMQKKPLMVHIPNSKVAKEIGEIVTGKILKMPKLRGFIDRKRIQRSLSRLEVSEENQTKDVIICSYRCSYWDNCEYQNGGFPCGVRNLEMSFHNSH